MVVEVHQQAGDALLFVDCTVTLTPGGGFICSIHTLLPGRCTPLCVCVCVCVVYLTGNSLQSEFQLQPGTRAAVFFS